MAKIKYIIYEYIDDYLGFHIGCVVFGYIGWYEIRN